MRTRSDWRLTSVSLCHPPFCRLARARLPPAESQEPLAHGAGGLPVLADALEEAGCDDREFLAHLRGGGPHCRGCFVVDALLGKG
jgi:hypothetical protein